MKTPGQIISGGRHELEALFELTRSLGGEVVEVDGDSVAEEILRFAREKRATFIVMGQSKRSRMDEIVRGSLVARIMRESDYVDLLVVADPTQGLAPARGGVEPRSRRRVAAAAFTSFFMLAAGVLHGRITPESRLLGHGGRRFRSACARVEDWRQP